MAVRGFFGICGLLMVLVGCQTGTDAPPALPTVADLSLVATHDAATAMAIASPTRRPLPPTFTPSPLPSATPTDPASVPSPTPEGFRAAGTIYYLINHDAIVELAADGSFEDLLPIPHIGQDIADLTLSPDGSRLTYTAPGSGSAREIYITDRQGSQTRQLSQLGFSSVFKPVWTFDSSTLAFIAQQSPEAPQSIYTINADGSEQRLLIQLPSTELRDPAWTLDGEWLLFSNQTLHAVHAVTGELIGPLTQFTGYGPDFQAVHSPAEPQLYYLKTRTNRSTGQRGGIVAFMNTDILPDPPIEHEGAALYVDSLRYSRDGQRLLIASSEGVWVQDQTLQTATKIIQNAPVAPRPVFSPDAERVAFVGLDSLGVEQIFVIDRRGGDATQITFHQEGTITDLQWAAG